MGQHASKMDIYTKAKLMLFWHLNLGVSEHFSAWLCNMNAL